MSCIDTRNAFEVEAGSFINALDFGIERFSQYPEAIAAHRQDFAGKTDVTFCTGGIRCEKVDKNSLWDELNIQKRGLYVKIKTIH